MFILLLPVISVLKGKCKGFVIGYVCCIYPFTLRENYSSDLGHVFMQYG